MGRGSVFPGVHQLSEFDVDETDGNFNIKVTNNGETLIDIKARQTDLFNASSVFKNLETASGFFKNGAVGFSPNKIDFDGLELKTQQWQIQPLQVSYVKSHFFENESNFPKGTVIFDNALLMQNIDHTWSSYTKKPEATADCI